MARARILLFLILLSSHASWGQSSIAIKGGVAFASFSGPGSNSLRNGAIFTIQGDRHDIAGYSAGVSANLLFNPFLAVNPELIFTQIGGTFKGQGSVNGQNVGADYTLRLNAVQVPVLFRANLGGEYLQFYLNIGPYFGYTFSGSVKQTITEPGAEPASTSRKAQFGTGDPRDNLQRFDFGYGFGGGAAVLWGPGKIGIDIRYQQGLVNVQASQTGGNDTRVNYADAIRNRLFVPSVFYALRIGKY